VLLLTVPPHCDHGGNGIDSGVCNILRFILHPFTYSSIFFRTYPCAQAGATRNMGQYVALLDGGIAGALIVCVCSD
jgi:hypothetical protein